MFHAPLSRRRFLARSSLLAFAPTIPLFLSHTARAANEKADGKILVVIQLNGGNDGINTVVPFADEGYERHRPKLRLPTTDLIKLSDQVALHPALRPAADLLEDGRLSIVQGVGYPNPNRSHDISMAIWQTARFEPTEHKTFGWIGRAMDGSQSPGNGSPHTMLIGDESPPIAMRGRRSVSVALAHLKELQLTGESQRKLVNSAPNGRPAPSSQPDDLDAFVRRSALDAYAAADALEGVVTPKGGGNTSYPPSQLGERLGMIAQLIKADFGTPVYYAIQGGYDTHAAKAQTHARLLRELAAALKAFLDDLKAARCDEQVLVLAFSEFGRRVEENASLGTDHGTAGPVILAGAQVKSRLIGSAPLLTDLDEGDLKMNIDFRNVYASVLDKWLGLPSEKALNGSFSPLDLLKV